MALKCGVAKSKQKLMAGFPPSDICSKFGASATLRGPLSPINSATAMKKSSLFRDTVPEFAFPMCMIKV